jgi:hypothetical protein
MLIYSGGAVCNVISVNFCADTNIYLQSFRFYATLGHRVLSHNFLTPDIEAQNCHRSALRTCVCVVYFPLFWPRSSASRSERE